MCDLFPSGFQLKCDKKKKTILKEKQRDCLKNFYEDTMKRLARTKERKKNAETKCARELEIDAPEIEKLYYCYYFIPISE